LTLVDLLTITVEIGGIIDHHRSICFPEIILLELGQQSEWSLRHFMYACIIFTSEFNKSTTV